MFQPRFYQHDCLRIFQKVRQKGIQRALAVMASGLGKTVTMAFDALTFRKHFPKARVLYLCHQNQIANQARGTFEAVNGSGCTYGYYNGLEKIAHSVDFLFASFQTMRTHLKNFLPDEFDYIVVDESHHTYGDTFLDVVTYWKPKFLLGMTATPDRTDGQDIRKVFGREVFYLPLEEALAQGLLAPVDYRLMTDEIRLMNVTETSKRRLSLKMLNRTIFVPRRDEEIVRIIKKHSQELQQPKTIVFCQSIQYCEHLAKIMPGAITIHSKISLTERMVRTELFRQGLIHTLLTVDVFNEGIDIPEANVIVFLRTTTSHVVFFQQLGRGLRLCEGKDRVIVLDFVGSCERVKTIYTLWDEVKRRRQKHLASTPSSRAGGCPRNVDPFYLNVGVVNFEEKILGLIDIVRRINDGYTREECISMLQAYAAELKRSPTQMEVHRNLRMPSQSLYYRYFGNYTEALKAAGLPVNQIKEVSDDELLNQLRSVKETLGHHPSQRELAKASKDGLCSCEPVFRKRFGSLNKALERIGSTPERQVGFTKYELVEQLKKLKDKLGRVPTVTDLAEASALNETASYRVFRERFKSWNNALRKAGLTDKKVEVHRYSDGDLFAEVKKAHSILGRVPTTGDMLRLREKGKIKASLCAFYSRFKNWEGALKAAGLN